MMYSLYGTRRCYESEYVVDLVMEDFGPRILQIAHAVAHEQVDKILTNGQFWDIHMMNTRVFVQTVAELAFAKMFNLPINLFNKGPRLPFGIAVRPTTRIGFSTNKPVLQEPYSTAIQADQTLVFANVAVEIGTDPAAVALGCNKFTPDQDWWAYQPIRVFFTGWETAAWVYSQELHYMERIGWARTAKAAFSCSVEDLLPAPCFDSVYLAKARTVIEAGNEFQPMDNWLDKRPPNELNAALVCTPPLPCVQCMAYNRLSENGLRQPPLAWKIANRQHVVDKETAQDMKSYRESLRSAIKWVTKAKSRKYGTGYRTSSSMFRKTHKQVFAEKRRLTRKRNRDKRR
jgi:hypothetical protein